MINNFLEQEIKRFFPYEPTQEQASSITALASFLQSHDNSTAFILRGYAGTGKTSLVGALVKAMDELKQKVVLLAPTGRAAKVFCAYAKHPAYTIHKKIYRQRSYNGEGGNFSLNDNLSTHTLFIIDEASMIANEGLSGATFGTGRLLDDLIQFVYSGQGCRLLLLGDTAQLPPVGEELSPALYAQKLEGYGLTVSESDLTQVVRQSEDSGILWNATRIRRLIAENSIESFPKIKVNGFPDICMLPGNELIETLNSCYDEVGMDETIVVCRSNKRAQLYNKGIRSQILYCDEELNSGDLLMVAKNNYYWAEQQHKTGDFIANGEIAIVKRVRNVRELYGFHFATVTMTFPDRDEESWEVTVLLDTLHSDAPALSREDSDRLFNAVMDDYADLPLKRDRMKKLKSDPYFNAVQVKYAYAVTCHKAQGGQWQYVFLDQGYLGGHEASVDYLRWLYTAFTRATKKLYLVNYPPEQLE